MELLSVAVSMLAVSRSRASAAFKDVRNGSGIDCLAAVLEACRVPLAEHARLSREALERAGTALERARASGIDVIPLGHAKYPPLLGCIPDPPPVLWTRGDADTLGRAAVAIVGSRAATPYALEVGYRLAGELAGRGFVIVSGLARGVDSAAHKGCLAAGEATVAVLGSGIERVYPHEHVGLALNVSKQGVLVSELAPDAEPLAEHFPLRNRIISGISLAVVVVEASENSGSLITARCALDQGRDVMAVPGSVLTGRNRGSHGLLKDGAKVVETADDILEGLGWSAAQPVRSGPSKLLETDPLLARMEAGELYSLEELSSVTGIAAPRLLSRLMELELRGAVSGVSGGRFTRASHTRW